VPRRNFAPRIEQILKPAHAQTLFPQPSVKAFDPPVLRRFARLNVDQLDPALRDRGFRSWLDSRFRAPYSSRFCPSRLGIAASSGEI
jgi:hypothetical protein